MVNLGVAGMGYIGRIHLEATQKICEARVLAVATRRPEEILSTLLDLQTYSTYHGLFRDDRLDAVLICLPTYLHEKAVVAAAKCGRHILCEKSMALDAASAQRMLQAAQANARIFMVAHILRFWPQHADQGTGRSR